MSHSFSQKTNLFKNQPPYVSLFLPLFLSFSFPLSIFVFLAVTGRFMCMFQEDSIHFLVKMLEKLPVNQHLPCIKAIAVRFLNISLYNNVSSICSFIYFVCVCFLVLLFFHFFYFYSILSSLCCKIFTFLSK